MAKKKSFKAVTLSLYSMYLFILLPSSLHGCTEFRISAKDKTVVVGRSMEWGDDMHSQIVVQPRGKQCSSLAPDGSQGLAWKSNYGFVFVNAYGLDAATDGMNEQGLSVGLLFFPGFGEYQTVPKGQNEKALSSVDFATWLLGNFSTVDEVRNALEKVYVWGTPVDLPKQKKAVLPCHYGVYDASGKGIVIEYTKDGLAIFDNEVGVLTNAPTYDWHVTNLRNYIGLSALQVPPIEIGNLLLTPIGQGTGMRGIPGDFTPPSRFVRTAAMKYLADPAENAHGAINLANHILNTVDIPIGTVKDVKPTGTSKDYSQWVVIKDLTNKHLYFRSYYNPTLQKIDLKKIDFSPQAKKISLGIAEGAPAYIEVTDKLK